MTGTPLFDVVISVSGLHDGTGSYDVTIVDRYHPGTDVIGQKHDMRSLDDAMAFARGAVWAFMKGTTA